MSLSLNNIGESVLYPDNSGGLKKDCVFGAHMTLDGRYLVIQDEVYSVEKDKHVGNIWENLNILDDMIQNFNLSYVKEPYRESIKPIITEAKKFILSDLSVNDLKQTINEGIREIEVNKSLIYEQESEEGIEGPWEDEGEFDKWYIPDFIERAWHSTRKAGGRGPKEYVLFILRALKNGMYTIGGIAIDIALIATGVGKVGLIVVWGLIVALDLWEMIFPEDLAPEDRALYKQNWWLQPAFLLCDAMGLFAAGAAAKAMRVAFSRAVIKKGASSAPGAFARNFPKLAEKLSKLVAWAKPIMSQLGQKIAKALNLLGQKMPVLKSFINMLKSVINKGIDMVGKLLVKIDGFVSGKAAQAVSARTGRKLTQKGIEAQNKEMAKWAGKRFATTATVAGGIGFGIHTALSAEGPEEQAKQERFEMVGSDMEGDTYKHSSGMELTDVQLDAFWTAQDKDPDITFSGWAKTNLY